MVYFFIILCICFHYQFYPTSNSFYDFFFKCFNVLRKHVNQGRVDRGQGRVLMNDKGWCHWCYDLDICFTLHLNPSLIFIFFFCFLLFYSFFSLIFAEIFLQYVLKRTNTHTQTHRHTYAHALIVCQQFNWSTISPANIWN